MVGADTDDYLNVRVPSRGLVIRHITILRPHLNGTGYIDTLVMLIVETSQAWPYFLLQLWSFFQRDSPQPVGMITRSSASSSTEKMTNQGRGGYNRGPDDDDEPEDGRGGYN